MEDINRTKEQLIKELQALRWRVVELEKSEDARKQAEEALRESEEELRLMVESMAEGIMVSDLGGNIVYVNQAVVRMHGYDDKQELIGRSAFELVAKKDHTRAMSNLKRILKEGQVRNVEYTFLRRDGSEFDAELSAAPLKDVSGYATGFVAITRDITERKEAERLLKTLTSGSPIGIYIVEHGRFQYVNSHFQRLTGYSEGELLGTDSLRLVLPGDRDMVRENAMKMLKGERSSPYEFRVVNKAGETRWVMETVTPIEYQGRQAVLGNYIDITEHKHLERKMVE